MLCVRESSLLLQQIVQTSSMLIVFPPCSTSLRNEWINTFPVGQGRAVSFPLPPVAVSCLPKNTERRVALKQSTLPPGARRLLHAFIDALHLCRMVPCSVGEHNASHDIRNGALWGPDQLFNPCDGTPHPCICSRWRGSRSPHFSPRLNCSSPLPLRSCLTSGNTRNWARLRCSRCSRLSTICIAFAQSVMKSGSLRAAVVHRDQ